MKLTVLLSILRNTNPLPILYAAARKTLLYARASKALLYAAARKALLYARAGRALLYAAVRKALLYARTRKARIFIFVVPVVLLALALVGGSSLLLRLFFLSALVLLVSYLWTVFGTRGISVQAEKPPEHCQVGEQFQQEITVFNSSRIPKLWLRVEGNTDMPGHYSAGILNLSSGGSHCWQSSVYCRRRGWYRLGSVIATATDPFGLFSRQRVLGDPHGVLVYPATIDLPLFKLLSLSDFGYRSGHRSITHISSNASSVRELTSGDSLRHIHWRSTAHTGKLMVKLFDADRSYNVSKTVWVILDMQEDSHLGQDEDGTEEYSVTIASSLIRKHLESGMRVGLMASGDQTYLFPPDRGEEHLWRVLEGLALMKGTGTVPVGQFILQQMEHFSDDAVVIVITPSSTVQVVDRVCQLRNRVGSVAAVLLDAASFGGNTNAANAARSLSLAGVQVFIVRQGDKLGQVLDNRFSLARTRYI